MCGITGIPVYRGMHVPWYRTAVQQTRYFTVFQEIIDLYFTFGLINETFKLNLYLTQVLLLNDYIKL